VFSHAVKPKRVRLSSVWEVLPGQGQKHPRILPQSLGETPSLHKSAQ